MRGKDCHSAEVKGAELMSLLRFRRWRGGRGDAHFVKGGKSVRLAWDLGGGRGSKRVWHSVFSREGAKLPHSAPLN